MRLLLSQIWLEGDGPKMVIAEDIRHELCQALESASGGTWGVGVGDINQLRLIFFENKPHTMCVPDMCRSTRESAGVGGL